MNLILPLLLGCSGGPPDAYATEKLDDRTLTVEGVTFRVGLELHGAPVGPTMGPEFNFQEGRDFWAYALRLDARRGDQPLKIRNLGGSWFGEHPGRPAPEPLREAFVAQGLETCVVGQGGAFRVPDGPWVLVWPVADEVLLQPTAYDSPGCGTVAADLGARAQNLAAVRSAMTACLALDRLGETAAAMACAAQNNAFDALFYVPPPEQGFASRPGEALTLHDRDALAKIVGADPERRRLLGAEILSGRAATTETLARHHILQILGPEGLLEVSQQAMARCVDPAQPCPVETLSVIADTLHPDGYVPPPPERCAQGVAFAQALWRRPEPEVDRMALIVIRDLSMCVDAEPLRPLMLRGLGAQGQRPPTPPPNLSAPWPTTGYAYDTVDNNCRSSRTPQHIGSVTVPVLCESLPRVAGTWLSHRCDDAAVARAKELVAAAPVLDPRVDEVVDGALRVLSRCDRPGFDAAISALPEKAPVGELMLGQDRFRAAYGI